MAETGDAGASKPPTPIDELNPLPARAFIGQERVITEGQLVLDPTQTAFTLKWGTVVINAIINSGEVDTKSTVDVDVNEANIVLNTLRNSDFYVKFKNMLKYGGNFSHLSIFLKPQAGVDVPAKLVNYTISSTPHRL